MAKDVVGLSVCIFCCVLLAGQALCEDSGTGAPPVASVDQLYQKGQTALRELQALVPAQASGREFKDQVSSILSVVSQLLSTQALEKESQEAGLLRVYAALHYADACDSILRVHANRHPGRIDGCRLLIECYQRLGDEPRASACLARSLVAIREVKGVEEAVVEAEKRGQQLYSTHQLAEVVRFVDFVEAQVKVSSPGLLFLRARGEMAQGQPHWANAKEYYTRALEAGPVHPDARIAYGLVAHLHVRDGEYEKAKEWYALLATHFPDAVPEAKCMTADILVKQGRLDEAVALCQGIMKEYGTTSYRAAAEATLGDIRRLKSRRNQE